MTASDKLPHVLGNDYADPDRIDIAEVVRGLRNRYTTVGAALRKQADILRVRKIEMPPELVEGLGSLEMALMTLENTLTSQSTELGQLNALAQTYALINSSLDPDEVLRRAMDELINLTGAERGFILILNPETAALEFRIGRGMGSDALEEEVSRTILRQVLDTGLPLLTDNASRDPRTMASDTVARFALRSVLCVPLISKEQITGAIYLDNRYRDAVFGDQEVNLVSAFANQTAVAVENAVLFAQVQHTLDEITGVKTLMENVLASIASGVITTDGEDRVTLFNRAAGEIFGLSEDGAIGRSARDLLPLDAAGTPGDVGEMYKIRPFGSSLSRNVREGEDRVTFETQSEIAGRGRVTLNFKFTPLKNTAVAPSDSQEGSLSPAATIGTAIVVDDMTAQRERETTLDLMSRYLPPGMVDNIHQIADLAMGGERREVTCVFMYACLLSEFPPDLPPQGLLELLNQYLAVATESIYAAQGVIDKYMGNEIMILFNTQLNPERDHALRAVMMALAMRTAYIDLYARMAIHPDPHMYCLGIHTGVATMGNVGSRARRNFTALGDSINLTKRIQESSEPGDITISGETYDHIMTHSAEAIRYLPNVRFVEQPPLIARGRPQATRIYKVFDHLG